jgi:hypothetical protein
VSSPPQINVGEELGDWPDAVIMAAGRVGGILANDRYSAHFLAKNLAMALDCIHVSHLSCPTCAASQLHLSKSNDML